MVYIPSCPEKKDGRGGLKEGETNLRAAEAPAGPFFRPAADVRVERSGLAFGLGPGPRRPLGVHGSEATFPENAPRPCSASRSSRAEPGLLATPDCQPRPDLGSLHLSAESGFFFFFLFRSSRQIFALPLPVYCQELHEGEESVRRSDVLSRARAPRETPSAKAPPDGSDGQRLIVSQIVFSAFLKYSKSNKNDHYPARLTNPPQQFSALGHFSVLFYKLCGIRFGMAVRLCEPKLSVNPN